MNDAGPRHNRRARQRYSFRRRCNAPVPPWGRCGHRLTGWQRIPIEADDGNGGRIMVPGPVIAHRPCGHSWLIGHGWMVGYGWDHSAISHSGQ
jgi:hypothetical protein